MGVVKVSACTDLMSTMMMMGGGGHGRMEVWVLSLTHRAVCCEARDPMPPMQQRAEAMLTSCVMSAPPAHARK